MTMAESKMSQLGTFSLDRDSVRQHGVIGFASLPLDRFCVLEAGGELALNADTRSSSYPLCNDGMIEVEILDTEGRLFPEWSGAQRTHFWGNTHCRSRIAGEVMTWPDERRMDALREQTLRLRFNMKHARSFSFEVQCGDAT